MKIPHRLLASAIAALVFIAGVSRANAPTGRYAVASGTVYDTKTKLTWQQTAPTGTYTWGPSTVSGTAQYYCANLSLSGGAWRLPTVKELLTLVDYSQGPNATAMIDSTAFPGTPAQAFWSATPGAGSSGTSAWAVEFSNGAIVPGGTVSASIPNDFDLRCVR